MLVPMRPPMVQNIQVHAREREEAHDVAVPSPRFRSPDRRADAIDLVLQEIEFDIDELALGRMPPAFAAGHDAPGAEGPVIPDRRGPALPGELSAVGRRRESILRHEIHQFAGLVEMQHRADRVRAGGVVASCRIGIDGFPADGRVDEGGRSQQAEIVEQGHRLRPVHLRPFRIHERHE
jgi:hypothetical protein